MKYNQKQLDEIFKYFREHPFECDFCHSKKWVINSVIYETPEFIPSFKRDAGTPVKSMPLVTLVCEKCGQVKFFNSISIGILNRETPTEEDYDKESDTLK